ncbi:hypothetical protein RRG08_008963 [Elysia crispata]|uniref:Uncharacterized protein n=1 Tax=Elysia crispata TaxID=231223 RepID=A0AAE1AHH6_9GAST|nr:hypothetical protein RRG08_008963 [Elysia crispata]
MIVVGNNQLEWGKRTQRSGIFPFNRDIFSDSDLAPSHVKERPEPNPSHAPLATPGPSYTLPATLVPSHTSLVTPGLIPLVQATPLLLPLVQATALLLPLS